MAEQEIDRLVQLLSRLPGLGPRSARRAVLHLLKRRESLMHPLATALTDASERVHACDTCGNLDTVNPCGICTDHRRDPKILCVVEDVADLWALERTVSYKGRYHVLGGTLSALDGVGPDDLRIPELVSRAESASIVEVILATSATVDGQTTAHYIADQLEGRVTLTSLAQGVPIGGELDYLDDGTISAALKARKAI